METKSLCAVEECGRSRQCRKIGRLCSTPGVEDTSRAVNDMKTHSLLDPFELERRSSGLLW